MLTIQPKPFHFRRAAFTIQSPRYFQKSNDKIFAKQLYDFVKYLRRNSAALLNRFF